MHGDCTCNLRAVVEQKALNIWGWGVGAGACTRKKNKSYRAFSFDVSGNCTT